MEAKQKTRNGNHAIVIGSGMAGLLSARILTEHFERITVVERDRLPQQPEIRQGVTQANHVHALLTQGYRILEEWFPGIEEKLIAAGAPCVSWAMESCFFHAWGCAKRSSSDLITVLAVVLF